MERGDKTTILIEAHDPLVFRDGRPFGVGTGNRMKVHPWATASSVIGSLRTFLGLMAGGDFNEPLVKELKALSFTGPLPYFDEELYFPAPADILWQTWDASEPKNRDFSALKPEKQRAGSGCNLPGNLHPVMLQDAPKEASKPAKNTPAWWRRDKMIQWLLGAKEFKSRVGEDSLKENNSAFLNALRVEERTHVNIDPDSGAAKDSMLFSTSGIDFWVKKGCRYESVKIALGVVAEGPFKEQLRAYDVLSPLGGERRLAHWQVSHKKDHWEYPAEISEALAKQKVGCGVRMVLATPALFEHGWRPRWLRESGGCWRGSPPGSSVVLRLVGVSCGRHEYISGWSYEKGKFGPKPSCRMVPAGSVYFFVVESDNAGSLKDLWLRSVNDFSPMDTCSKNDGYGAALWGLWDATGFENGEESSS